jgi:hypothetical protein
MKDQSPGLRMGNGWVQVALIAVVTALLVAPLTALATHSFTDVSDSNTFHDDIAWLKDSGVTKGCNPPDNTEYCPDDNVTRGQMAAFMHRNTTNLAPRAAFNSNEGPDNTGGTRTLSAEITAPGRGTLVMNGSMLTFTELTSATATCWLEINDVKVLGSETHTTQEQIEDSGCTVSGAQVVDAGTYSVDFEASGPDWYWDETVWVMWIPLDGTGLSP